MEAHMAEELEVTAIARQEYLSAFHFQRFFLSDPIKKMLYQGDQCLLSVRLGTALGSDNRNT